MSERKRASVYKITKGKCFYCGCNLDKDNFHMDHFCSKQAGGRIKDNLVPCCPDCNLSKGAFPVEAFREKIQTMIVNTHCGRVISKYYRVKPKPIKFFFEETKDGDIQNNINELLDRQQGGR